jgi:hypothetical protein
VSSYSPRIVLSSSSSRRLTVNEEVDHSRRALVLEANGELRLRGPRLLEVVAKGFSQQILSRVEVVGRGAERIAPHSEPDPGTDSTFERTLRLTTSAATGAARIARFVLRGREKVRAATNGQPRLRPASQRPAARCPIAKTKGSG